MRFKSYDQFLTESFLDRAKAFLKRVGDFFKGVGSQFLNFLILHKEKKAPKGVTFYPTTDDIKLLKAEGIDVRMPHIEEVKESELAPYVLAEESLDEAVIQTKYPDLGKIRDVNSKSLRAHIRDAVEGGPKIKPLLIWGAPGIGKTAIINAIAKEYFGPNAKEEKRMIDFDLMSYSPEEFFMPTVINKDDPKKARKGSAPDAWLPVRPIDAPEMEDEVNGPDGKGGILFFDEIARCNPKIQNICLKLIDERKVGNYVLGKNWIIISAANRKSDLSDDEQAEFHWSSTLANRFRQINYAATLEDWTPWAMSAKDDLGELIVKPEIVAFLKFNQKYFHLLDPEAFSNTSGGSEAWPSPRSWTDASQAIKTREKRYEKDKWKDEDGQTVSKSRWMDEQEEILSAQVGEEAAKAFVGFQKLMNKINPEDIDKVYTNAKEAPSWKGLGLDEKYALIAAACFQKRDAGKLTKDEMKNFADWLIVNKDAPNAVKAMRMLSEVVPSVTKDDNWNKVVWEKLNDAFPHVFDSSRQKD